MEDDENVQDSEYAEYLEESIGAVMAMKPDAMCFVAISDETGMAFTNYYQADTQNMGEFIRHIATDYIMEVIKNNASLINNYLIEAENDEDGEVDDEIE